jgi:BirA family biotin operon repressor/biotin-[acetyl-CoA-carboxylase] ligase
MKRPWTSEKGKNLLFTILLRFGDIASIPEALTLRTGLAVSLAIEDFAPSLAASLYVKWPNDVMIGSRKAAGILTETDGQNVFIGVGVNVAQKEFPGEYRSKAVSIIQVSPVIDEDSRFALLEKILFRLHEETEKGRTDWRERLLKRLYKLGETVSFAEGAADSERLVTGKISGIGQGGELLIIPCGEKKERAFVTGELRVYG